MARKRTKKAAKDAGHEFITVRLKSDEAAQVKEMADLQGVGKSTALRMLIKTTGASWIKKLKAAYRG